MGHTSKWQFHTQWSHFWRQMVTVDYDSVSTHLMIIQRGIFLFSWSLETPTDFFFFVQKYSIWSVLCRNIHIMAYCAKILVRYRYMLHENEANQLITCRFSKFLIQLCKKKRFLWGFVLKYYFLGESCRNITVPRY